MTYPPSSGGPPDPYQPQQPYGQPYDPNAPYSAQPSSGQPQYGQQPPQAYGQPYGAPPPYGPPQMYAAPATTNTMAILALVFAFIFPPAGIVMGHVAKKQLRETGEQGEGLATAGLWLGYIFTSLIALVCAGYVLLAIFAIGSAASNSGSF